MITYTLAFADTTKTPFSIFPFTSNGTLSSSDPILLPRAVTANTTLKLYGRGLDNYGEGTAQNFLYLTENFANSTRPVNSIEGQIWYDNSPTAELFIRNDNVSDLAGGPGWIGVLLATGTSPMTGELILSGNPVNPLGAAPMQYVDTQLSAHVTDPLVHITTDQNTFLDALDLTIGIPLTAADVNQLIGVTGGNIQTQIDGKLNLAGGTMMAAANILFVGGTPTGLPLITVNPTDAASKSYVDGLILGAGTPDGLLTSINWLPDNPVPAVVVADTELEFTISIPAMPSVTITANGISRVGHTHQANEIPNVPFGTILATDVQGAIDELATEKAQLAAPTFTGITTMSDMVVTTSGQFTGTVTGITPILPAELTTKAYVDALIVPSIFDIDIDTAGGIIGLPLVEDIFPVGWTTEYNGIGDFTITHNQSIGAPPFTMPGFALTVLFDGTVRIINPSVIDTDSIDFRIMDDLGMPAEGRIVGRLIF